MSYILEALQRAQAERERGLVPGLAAQPVGASGLAPAPRLTSIARWAVALLSSLTLALTLAWYRLPGERTGRPEAALVVVPAAPQQPAVGLPSPPPSPPPSPSPPPVPVPVPVPVPLPLPAEPAAARAGAAPPVRADGAALVPASAAATAMPLVPLSQLGPDERREWPAFALGGGIWSESPASRFVIVDGQVRREGDTLAPGLVLEQIDRKSVVLRWRDRRVEVRQ
jgi:general secretion pathway protein B